MINLYAYQQDVITEIRSAWMTGLKSLIVSMPTGSGKTVVFSWMCQNSNKRILILTHRVELLTQTGGTLSQFGVDFAEVKAGLKHPPTARVTVAMTGTLKNRLQRPDWVEWWKGIDLVVIDEAHQQDMDHVFPTDKFVLGFTATPRRTGKQTQLSENYQRIIEGPDVEQLIRAGYLVPDKYFGVPVNLAGIGRDSRGEYKTDEMFERYHRPEIYTGVVENWNRICPGAQTIVFCVNIQHAINTAKAFDGQARYLVSDLQGDTGELTGQRKEIVEAWKRREFPVLVNAGILTTGFDHRPTECVIVSRATTSENLWLQMVGRGSRTAPGKGFFYLLDFGENALRLGHYRQQRQYSLTHEYREGDGSFSVKNCPTCGALLMASAKYCKYCGFVFPKSKVEVLTELIEQDFAGLLRRASMADLDQIAELKGYKKQWVWRQVWMKQGEAGLREYAKMHGYKFYWVLQQMKMFAKK